MKISYMLRREDFYSINEKTLAEFFGSGNSKKTTLHIYPHLNAIITANPSKKVKEYIYTEYSVNGSIIKKLLVWGYTRLCLNSFGILASRKITLPAEISSHTLIYPCNRKFRIFDFDKNEVSVITKHGFPKNSIHNEISFRTSCERSEFILPVCNYTEDTYSEKIIDGIPLARIETDREKLEKEALSMWQKYSGNSKKTVPSAEYAKALQSKIDLLMEKIIANKPDVEADTAKAVIGHFISRLQSAEDEIEIIQSHGDLQAGNIWVENSTGKIYIIDWESVDTRSVWYDEAVLYDDIRKPHCFEAFAKADNVKHTAVVLEEIIYRMNELCELPEDYGTGDFNIFIKKLEI